MSLETLLEAAEQHKKSLVVYAPDPTDVTTQFNTRNARIDHHTLPEGATEGFITIRDDDQFRGAISLSSLETYLEPPIHRPWNLDALSPEYRALFELLDNTLFGSLSRRQLLATARELEDRAYREGAGTFRVGFQSLSAFTAQKAVYRRLADETALDIHIYVRAEASTADMESVPVTFHTEPADQVGRFWFLMFDGNGDDRRKCALVAEERDPDSFYGFWTYEPTVVDQAFAAITDG